MNRYNYSIYDLNLSSNIKIPCLIVNHKKHLPKYTLVEMGEFPKFLSSLIDERLDDTCIYSNTASLNLSVYTLDNEKYYYFKYTKGIEFICTHDGLNLWITWKEPYSLEDATSYLLGVALGFILRLQNIVCLHASAVMNNDGHAIAFSGDSGTGKSIIATALMSKGFKLITEDIMPLKKIDNTFLSIPGYPHLRLFKDTFQKLDIQKLESSLISDTWDKHFIDLSKQPNSFSTHPVPLERIYILDWKHSETLKSPKIEKVNPMPAVPLLAAQSWANILLSTSLKTEEFIFLTHLVTEIPVKRILMCNNLDKLPELIQLIIKDTEG